MFCGKCGNYLEDTARFCDKCGTSTGIDDEKGQTNFKQSDDEVLFRVKPAYKAMYYWYDTIAIVLTLEISAIVLGVIMTKFLESEWNFWLAFLPLSTVSIVIVLIKGIVMSIKKKQIKNTEYLFYKTKVVYRDSFLDQHEKEIKYKYIRECVLEESFGLRIFGLGNIILHTNAEGFSSGMVICFIENAKDVYKKIKELLDK